MTGVGDLFSNLQPVTENRSTLSLSAWRCGAAAPQKGSAETLARTQGKAFPFGRFEKLIVQIAKVACADFSRSRETAKAPAGSGFSKSSSRVVRSSQAKR